MNNLTVPFTASLPVSVRAPVLEARYATCPVGRVRQSLEMACIYSSGRNASVGVDCDGTRSLTPYRCPAASRCVWWDAAEARWIYRGRNRLPVPSPYEATLSCALDRPGVFSAMTDPITDVRLSRQGDAQLQPEPIEYSYGLIIAGKASVPECSGSASDLKAGVCCPVKLTTLMVLAFQSRSSMRSFCWGWLWSDAGERRRALLTSGTAQSLHSYY